MALPLNAAAFALDVSLCANDRGMWGGLVFVWHLPRMQQLKLADALPDK